MARKAYTSDSIRLLSGLNQVREHPSMYIGSTDEHGLFLILRELLDNVVDEFGAGRATLTRCHVDTTGYWVLDDGEGVPQGTKETIVQVNGEDVKSKLPTMQAIFGNLHTSGKHSDAYETARGVHGVGAKGTNALSTTFQVWTFFEGKWYYIEFAQGKLVSEGVVSKRPPADSPFGKISGGTLIHYVPDTKIFTAKTFPATMLHEWAELTAYLNPKFKININYKGQEKEYFSKLGPREYLDNRIAFLKANPLSERLAFEATSPMADVVVSFTDYDGQDLRGATNGLTNSQGGTHVNSVQNGLFRAVKEHTKKKQTFTALDFRDGLVGIVNAKLSGAKFSSQAKVQLTDERMGTEFETWIYEQAKKFFAKNPGLAAKICERASKLNELKNSFRANKNALREIAKAGKQMPAKFAKATQGRPEDRELFLVEGDSAGGTAKTARFPWQAVLPLKGKILNAAKASGSRALESESVAHILGAMGFDPRLSDPYSKLTVGKVICLADPDPDGPFVAGTVVQVQLVGETALHSVKIEDLVTSGVKFKVPAWTGKSIKFMEATAVLVRNVDEIVSMEIGGTKYKVDPDHKWAVTNVKSWEEREGTVTVDHAHGITWKRARDITSGDRIFTPGAPTERKNSHQPYQLVSKCKVQKLKEPVPVYCLSVKGIGNFVTPAGHVSSNCHINTLLLTLFHKFMPRLLEDGIIYVVDAPEFYATYKDQMITGDTLSEVQKKLEKVGAPAKTPIQHIKGWGEVNAKQLRPLAMDAATRRLIRVRPPASTEENSNFQSLMNDDVEFRRNLLGV